MVCAVLSLAHGDGICHDDNSYKAKAPLLAPGDTRQANVHTDDGHDAGMKMSRMPS